jgi:hypothetical protein
MVEKKFLNLDFSVLGDNWYAKDGAHAAHDAAVEARAKEVSVRLCDLVEKLEREGSVAEGRGEVVMVIPGVFMKFLVKDETIDLPKAG